MELGTLRKIIFACLALVGVLVTLLVVTKAPVQNGSVQTATTQIGGPFELINNKGQKVTEADFKGKPFLVFFGFTYCPDICPTALFEMTQVFNELGADAEKINGVFVTVDVERDTPEHLDLYLTSFHKNIHGLTGSQAAIDNMVKQYKAYAKKVTDSDGGYTMDHTAVVYIMDKDGQFVAPLNLKRPPLEVANELRVYL